MRGALLGTGLQVLRQCKPEAADAVSAVCRLVGSWQRALQSVLGRGCRWAVGTSESPVRHQCVTSGAASRLHHSLAWAHAQRAWASSLLRDGQQPGAAAMWHAMCVHRPWPWPHLCVLQAPALILAPGPGKVGCSH